MFTCLQPSLLGLYRQVLPYPEFNMGAEGSKSRPHAYLTIILPSTCAICNTYSRHQIDHYITLYLSWLKSSSSTFNKVFQTPTNYDLEQYSHNSTHSSLDSVGGLLWAYVPIIGGSKMVNKLSGQAQQEFFFTGRTQESPGREFTLKEEKVCHTGLN